MSKDIQTEINNNVGLVNTLNSIGVIYDFKNDVRQAEIYLKKRIILPKP